MKDYAHLHTPHYFGARSVVYVNKGGRELIVSFAYNPHEEQYLFNGIVENEIGLSEEDARAWFEESSHLPIINY